jgi:hypothetical protein
MTGELERELWFDANSTLVRVRFHGRDGSDIELALRRADRAEANRRDAGRFPAP